MSYDTDTAQDVGRAVKQCPGDLKALLYKYGEFLPIEQIQTRYVTFNKNSSGHEFYIEVSEGTKGAIQVLTIA